VPRSSGRRDGAATPATSNGHGATGTGGTTMPGKSTASARTAERPPNNDASKSASVDPIGLTTPAPVTKTGAAAMRSPP